MQSERHLGFRKAERARGAAAVLLTLLVSTPPPIRAAAAPTVSWGSSLQSIATMYDRFGFVGL